MAFVRIWTCALLGVALLGAAHPAAASWTVYVAGDFGISTSSANVSGTNTVNGTANPALVFAQSGTDTSPLIGGAVGLQSPMDEVTAWGLPFGWRLPRWPVRLEIEATGLRAFEFKTGSTQNRSFFTVSNSWSLMSDAWLDIPLDTLDRPIAAVFGRTPRWVKRALGPSSFYMGAGVGMAGLEIETTDNVFDAQQQTYNFAWQVGTGFGYELTKFVTLGLGYRFIDQGRNDTDLRLQSTAPSGAFAVSQRVHEFRTQLRVDVYDFPSPWR